MGKTSRFSRWVATDAATAGELEGSPRAAMRADWRAFACGAVLAGAAIAAYGRTFSGPLIYDDVASIVGNPSIRHLGSALFPPPGSTVSGRPVLNFTLAINYAIGGASVAGYHATNLAIHVMAGLALFGVARRVLAPRFGGPGVTVAFCAALLWTVHPLLTESVTYVIQRAESLMGLFYLLTLYCLTRGHEAGGQRRRAWYALSITACCLGMGTKEVMVSAPLVALLFDRAFLAGSFREAWRRRRGVYAGLAATWAVVPFLVLSTHGRGGTVGFASGVPWWSYALTQFPAVVHYLRLCFWPHPLVFDYGGAVAATSLGVLPCALFVVALVAATGWALVRSPGIGFLGASFFAVLAPSSSIVPVVTETMAEHRMYLPLIPVVVLAVLGIQCLARRATLPLCLALSGALAWATWVRNESYASEERIWSATVAEAPGNERAQNDLGIVLAREPGRLDEAISHFREAVRLAPDYADAHYNLGLALSRVPARQAEAVGHYEAALSLRPDNFDAHENLGNALVALGRIPEAVGQYEVALRLRPDDVKAHYNLGSALSSLGRTAEAAAQFEEALHLRPDYPEAHYSLGNAFDSLGRTSDAISQFEEAVRLKPDFVEAHNNLGCELEKVPGRLDEAVAQFETALRLKPDHVEARYNLGSTLQRIPGRLEEAVLRYREALRLKPDYVEARYNLGNALYSLGRMEEAIAQYEEAIRLRPGYVAARCNLGIALKSVGRIQEAIAQYEEALRLRPDDATVHLNLGVALLRTPGRTAEAVAHLREAVRLAPDNPLAGRILARLGLAEH